jgi:hypothetical protein
MSDESFNTNQVIYRVEYRDSNNDAWKTYYTDPEKADALDMYARHISTYTKEQCRMLRTTVGTEIYSYVPVNQEGTDDE